MTYDALLLVSFGGPEGPDDVWPFLLNVTRGRGIPEERLRLVEQHYLRFGGVSPINAQNRELIAALESSLRARGCELPIYWGNRNWSPYIADALREIAAAGHTRVLAVTTSAYSSYSGCRQYRENVTDALAETGLDLHIDVLRPYFALGAFADVYAGRITEAIGERDPQSVQVLFTTHSIPTAMNEASGPPTESGAYVSQHRDVAERIMAQVGAVDWELVFQSRSGPPQVPWLEPDVNDAISGLTGKATVVVVPIGFISDHVEVVWDLDTEAKATAEAAGLEFIRIPTVGTDDRFVSGLADRLIAAADRGAPQCPTGCCAKS